MRRRKSAASGWEQWRMEVTLHTCNGCSTLSGVSNPFGAETPMPAFVKTVTLLFTKEVPAFRSACQRDTCPARR